MTRPIKPQRIKGASQREDGWPKPKRPALVKPRMPAKAYWSCNQISYGLSPADITEGMRVGFCEHALREFPEGKVPSTTRFILATVSLNGSLMKLTFDAHPDGTPWMMCGVEAYARFCIPADPHYVSVGERMVRDYERSHPIGGD